MATMWNGNTEISNIQGIDFSDNDVFVSPYLAAGDYHWRLIADDNLASGNNVTFHKFDPSTEGFTPAKFNDNDAGWTNFSGSPALRSQLINSADGVALDLADSGASYDNLGYLGTSSGSVVRDIAQAFTLASDVEFRKLKVYINLKNGNGPSGINIGIYSGSTYGSGTHQAYRNSQAITTAAGWYTSPNLTAASNMEGIFLIHDSGATCCDAGFNQSWDFSSFDEIATLSDVKYQYASYASDQNWSTAAEVNTNASWNETWLTLVQLQAISNNGNRYFYLKCKLVNTPSRVFSYFQGDAYQVDVTSPGVPTVAKTARFETDNYSLIWTEPTDGDYAHCELKRIIDSTIEYLNSVAGIPTWQEATGTPFEFIDGDAAAGWLQSNYTDEDVSGSAIAHYVRSVDAVNNVSGWVLFSVGTIPAPTIPTLTLADSGDGSGATATISGSDSGSANNIYVVSAGSSSWVDQGSRSGDGAVDLSLGVGNYWAYCKSSVEGAGSVTKPIAFAVSDAETGVTEIRAYLRSLLLGDTALVNLLGAINAVYWQNPPHAAVYPCITYFEEEEKESKSDAGHGYRYSFTCHSDSQATNDQMVARITEVFNNLAFTTASWEIRKTTPLGRKVNTGDYRDPNGLPVREVTLRYHLHVFAANLSVSFTKGEDSCILPPPAEEIRKEHSLAQATGFTAGGTRVVADGGSLRKMSSLSFQSLSTEEFDTLADFFSETTTGMQETFTYTDLDEVAHTVRFADPEIKFIQVAPEIYDVSISLEEED